MESTTSEYSFVNLSGSSYEIGRQQGLALRQIPPFAAYMSSTPREWAQVHHAEMMAMFREFCPGLDEELAGLADGLGVSPEQIAYGLGTYLLPPRCSHMAIMPDRTVGGKTLVGRSYDFGPESNDNRLCLTRVDGRYSHLGFSSVLLGRLDGMNDHGLTVTMSAGGIPVGNLPGLTPPLRKGLQFWAAIRAVLENCADVPAGIDFLRRFPHGGNPVLILADRSGQAARVEIYGEKINVEQIDRGAVWAGNHFQSHELRDYSTPVLRNSLHRVELMRALAERPQGMIGVDDLRGLLGTEYPHGLCCHFYREFFGTMHSLVFDPAAGEAWICFGSPVVNEWRRFTLSPEQTSTTFQVSLPQAEGFKEFWG